MSIRQALETAISATARVGTAIEGTEGIAVIAVGINAKFSLGREAPDKNNAEQSINH